MVVEVHVTDDADEEQCHDVHVGLCVPEVIPVSPVKRSDNPKSSKIVILLTQEITIKNYFYYDNFTF